MYQVIARKYRRSLWRKLISQEHVKTTLENAINQKRIAHGYIFSGQRGTGKTTVARIFARCLKLRAGTHRDPLRRVRQLHGDCLRLGPRRD